MVPGSISLRPFNVDTPNWLLTSPSLNFQTLIDLLWVLEIPLQVKQTRKYILTCARPDLPRQSPLEEDEEANVPGR